MTFQSHFGYPGPMALKRAWRSILVAAVLGSVTVTTATGSGADAPAAVSQTARRGSQIVLDPLKSYPDAYNTGPSGTLTVINHDVELNQPGQSLRNAEVRGTVNITSAATGAVLDNVRITWPSGRSPGGTGAMVVNRAANVSISNCEVNGGGQVLGGIFLVSGPVTVDRCNVSGAGDAIQAVNDVTVTNSYLHGMSTGPTHSWHVDTVQINVGRRGVYRHNTIINEFNQTAAFGLWAELGAVDDILIEDNLIGGGGFTIYATKVGFPMTNVRFINNRFTSMIWARVGYWATDSPGYAGIVYPTGLPADLVWSGNVYHETGLPVPL